MFRCICMEMKLLEMCIVLSRPDEANWQLVELAASPWYLVFVKILKFICMNLKSICLEIEIVVKCIGAKQVRCRRLATGRAGRLSLAPKPPAAPTHSLGFYSPPGFAEIFYFQISVSAFLYFSSIASSDATKLPLLRKLFVYSFGSILCSLVSLWISICHSHDSLRLPDWHVHRRFIFPLSLLNGTTSVIH